jgi:Ser/Thr protein kinase RdoA (MazF antagonist)
MIYDDSFLSRLEFGLRAVVSQWGVSADSELSLLTISENATFKIKDAASGKRMILRVHRPDYHNQAQILSELAWIEALRLEGVVTTPKPIPTRDGFLLTSFSDGQTFRYVVAFEYMSGHEPDTEADMAKWYGKLGEINARLHAHSRRWQRPANFARKTWDFDTIIGEHAYWGNWRNALGLNGSGKNVLERVHTALKDKTARYGKDDDRFGLIHCDMRAANLLVDGERLGVIDFDDCGLSWFAYDFPAAISFMEHRPIVEELKAAWLDGYRKVAAFASEHEKALPMLIMLRRMQLTAWIASHAETPTAQKFGNDYTQGTIELAERYLSNEA